MSFWGVGVLERVAIGRPQVSEPVILRASDQDAGRISTYNPSNRVKPKARPSHPATTELYVCSRSTFTLNVAVTP